MKQLFLFSFSKKEIVKKGGSAFVKYLVLFYPYKGINEHLNEIYNQLRTYFQRNILPNRIIVLCAEYNQEEIKPLFEEGSELLDYIPFFKFDSAEKNISIYSLQASGSFLCQAGFHISNEFLKEVLNRGMVKIFNENGGLIVSQSAHHFVFPSGKHSDRFLRPGNVLLRGTQIQFIAFALYVHFNGRLFSHIYCDTSSINSLAYAYNALSKEFDSSFKELLHIESFGSYQGFENAKFNAPKDCMFLISSSTSGSIIKRIMQDKRAVISEENIGIVYGLYVDQEYSKRIVCDLSFENDKNPEGLKKFSSYNVSKGHDCQFCKDKSKAVEVKGDVFLLEKPSVSGVLISKTDHPTSLKNLTEFFKKGKAKESIIRCFHKENSSDDKKYEIYFDIETLLNEFDTSVESNSSFLKIFIKLEKYIMQNVPALLKYIIVLPDISSEILAKIILKILHKQGVVVPTENILKLSQLSSIDKKAKGAILIVSSSVATGRNLLFISRALRETEENYQRVYFNFLNRTSDQDHNTFIESNLSLGEFGRGTHKIINIENLLCAPEAFDTPWHVEIDFLKLFCEHFEDLGKFPDVTEKCRERIKELEESGKKKGLDDNLFFESLSGTKLEIRKGFAFAPSNRTFTEEATQADIYFIICTIIHEIRQKDRLYQSEYVRNLLEPGNFVRYNDGIIQAAILRAAKNDELSYDLSETMSHQMQAVIEDMVNHIDDEHAEGLIEFLYAIAIKKLKLTQGALMSCLVLIKGKPIYSKECLLKAFVDYIDEKILAQEKKSQISLPMPDED
jgi:hypothetical protein